MRLSWAGTAVAVLLAAPNVCRNECDFVERCRGDVRQVCGGVDQVVGRSIREEACAAPNGSCVEDGLHAYCVRTPATRCDASFVPRCEGTAWVHCFPASSGFVVVDDCAAVKRPDGSSAGLTCGAGASGAAQCLEAR